MSDAYRQVGSYDKLRKAGGAQTTVTTADDAGHFEETLAQRLYGKPYDKLNPDEKHDVDEYLLAQGDSK